MKKIMALLVVFVMVFAATAALAADITVQVNGETVSFDREPEIRDNKVLIPYRFVAEKLGALVAWDGETKTIFTSIGDTVSTMQIGNNNIFINDTVLAAEVAPLLPIDRTLVTEEVLEGCLGVQVSWDVASGIVTVTK